MDENEEDICSSGREYNEEFAKALKKFLYRWERKKRISNYDMIFWLISEIKTMSCREFNCFYHMLGTLTFVINFRLQEVYNKINNIDQQNEGGVKNE